MDTENINNLDGNKLLSLRDSFMRRYLEWALSDTMDQYSRGFPLLQLVKSSGVRCILQHMKLLEPAERETLLKAAWKSLSTNIEQKHPTLTQDESKLLEELRNALLNRYAEFGEDLNRTISQSNSSPKLNKRVLRSEISKHLTPVLKSFPDRWGPQEWRFKSRVGQWNIYTFIDIGGKWQCRYEHKIGLRENVYLAEHIDLQGWMGLGHTKWDEITCANTSEAAAGLAEICAHFLRAAPRLLEGIIPPQL
jgi:hypothetical protein